ncbi:MAG: Type I Iterative PKS [Bogoriella megaspora]|nr:MAG: Type I Iterative PKS [Bogoriella megaspora]
MHKSPGEPIAIIGSACHFAGNTSSPSRLWDLLRDPQDVRHEIPDSRFCARGFYHHNHAQPGHSNVRHSYLLDEDLSVFDAEFFGIKPLEAKAIDPQQRWLMETVYESLEAGGLTIQGLKGSDTSVYVGVMCSDYESMLLRDLEATPTYFATGTSRSMLSNRISYIFDWHGPSITIDTACSSSLVAVHMAVQALRTGDSRVAIACGSNLILGPENYIIESKLKMLSPDGVCRMWDKDANGYARGDGVAAIVLKTLSAALADGDSIECVIRETGLNQDGATHGITIPSASAQKALIRDTYAKAGLNPLKEPRDRPQYFEAHGTGTPAGDPAEAEAISNAFFEDGNISTRQRLRRSVYGDNGSPLFVGSIKTVLGHTEGAAGLAGILKASLALQNATIPPNLQFRHLSDRVAPFYQNLEIVQNKARPWPVIHEESQQSRRASVNSFGFGGANAHAILESYSKADSVSPSWNGSLFTPFLLSASSEHSLRANLKAYLDLLDCRPLLNKHDLAWTLRQRRTLLAHRTYFVAESIEELRNQLSRILRDEKSAIGVRFNDNSRTKGTSNELLGIFTGQGAQFARLGAELFEQSSVARQIILELEAHLAKLSADDRPLWSLSSELVAPNASSRVNEAAIAQPLCTAVQILLVDLLGLAGVHFDAVIGHSSGEIGAAYAVGILSARDAILIAYFRGVHVSHAESPNGKHIRGAMVAVGTSMEDAEELCNDDVYTGRLVVAACNSPSSVTISGDEDAIEELQDLLEDEKKFYRRLRVDTAYHSRHMDPCFAPYAESLRRYDVRVLKSSPSHRPRACQWFSSVNDQVIEVNEDIELSDTYWAENMTCPVLFSQALRTALLSRDGSGFTAIIEVGPHPALQGPAGQTIQEILGRTVPYQSTLVRGTSAVTALSTTLGFVWQHFQPDSLDANKLSLDRYERAMANDNNQGNKQQQRRFELLKGLPNYQWNHTIKHWSESRISRRMRLRQDPYHPLLGHATPDSSRHHLRWRNLLRTDIPNEQDNFADKNILGLEGHRVQGQVVFPAAGYVATAIEAARALPLAAETPSGSSSIKRTRREKSRLIVIHDMEINQAMILGSDKNGGGVETLVELADITATPESNRISARFLYSAALGRDDDSLTLAASARLEVHTSEDELDPTLLPARPPVAPHLVDVEKERFYTFLASLGYEYEGPFRSMTVLKRKHGKASCLVKMRARTKPRDVYRGEEEDDPQLLLQPSELDATFQSLLLAYSYPGDDRLRALHLPLRIGCIRVNPALCGGALQRLRFLQGKGDDDEVIFPVDATILRSSESGSLASPHSYQTGFGGDINVYAEVSTHAAIQVQNVQLVPLEGSSDKEKDRKVFTKMQWVEMAPNGSAAAQPDNNIVVSPKGRATLIALERIAIFYLRQFDAQVPPESPLRSPSEIGATAYYLQYAKNVLSSLAKDWPDDTPVDIQELTKAYADLADMGVMQLVGQTMPSVFRGEMTMLEKFRETRLLDEYYVHGFSPAPSGRWQSRVVEHIADRHPHLNMLEIGAGTGGTTKPILDLLGPRFQSYTFTDISAGFFGDAAAALSSYQDRLVFQTLDIEKDPLSQGFHEGTYDVVIASFVLHATASLSVTLANVRKLLRPGGRLIVGEGSLKTPASSFIFGPLDGWWLGREDGRVMSPHVSTAQWDRLLCENGFSGIETKAPDAWEDILGVCLFVSQAVDDEMQFLRSPLSFPMPRGSPMVQKLVLVGGLTARISWLVGGLQALLKSFASELHVFPSLTDVEFDEFEAADASQLAVLSLTELDKPVFKDMTEADFIAFQSMFQAGKTLLWVTTGRQSVEPYSNMVIGFGRTAVNETAGLNLQHLDLANPEKADTVRTIAETFLRLVAKPALGEQVESVDTLWTTEPEIVVDADGRFRVPRLRPIKASNDRYNSGRRPVTQDIDINAEAVNVCRSGDGTITLEKQILDGDDLSSNGIDVTEICLSIRISYAIPLALRTPFGYRFLAFGVDASSGTPYLVLVLSLASLVDVPMAHTVPCSSGASDAPKILFFAAAHIIASAIIGPHSANQTIIVHNAKDSIVQAVKAQAIAKGVASVFIADSNLHAASESSIISIPPYLSHAELWKLLPRRSKIACFVSLAPINSLSGTRDAIVAALPSWSRRETVNSLYSTTGYDHGLDIGDGLRLLLVQALNYTEQRSHDWPTEPRVLGLSQLMTKGVRDFPGETGENGKISVKVDDDHETIIVDMKVSTKVPVHIRRLDASRPMFKPNRTYWLVGLSGALALAAVRDSIAAAHPPIAGVLNGAMVLRDTSVRNMTFAQLNDVVRPKVIGSLNLDRLFSSDQPPLDFFLLLSSINCIIGNQGQANYAAANTFQGALAASRRRRGLAGIALNVGAIIGAGYIQRSSKRVLDLTVSRGAMMHLSEEDFHQLVAEAVAAGNPGHRYDGHDGVFEISTGLLDVPYDTAERPVWFADPKFTHLIVRQSGSVGASATSGGSNVNANAPAAIRERLQASRSSKELSKIVTEAFAATLRHELQMTNVGDEELMGMRGNDIGLDSLVSVDIRSWFLKTLSVSIPVLRIMSNESMAMLVRQAVELLPSELVPGMAGANANEDKTAGQSNAQSVTEASSARSSDVESSSSATSTLDVDHDQIDWDAETLPPTIDAAWIEQLQTIPNFNQAPRCPPETIVVTGVTGLLGHHLLNQLIRTTTNTTKIICVAIRQLLSSSQPDGDLPFSNIDKTDRTTFYAGDLSLPHLGLSPSDYTSIFASADAVVHVGADTSHLKPYKSLRDANVGSTAELIRLCLSRKIPLHFISSAGVGLFSNAPEPELWPVPAPGIPPTSAEAAGGYTASKWACERLLERTNAQYGLPVWIHRPSTIVREGADAEGERARLDWMNGLVRYSRELKAVPEVKHVKGALDMVFVQNVCKKILRCMFYEPSGLGATEGNGVSYIHEVGDVVIPLDLMQDLLGCELSFEGFSRGSLKENELSQEGQEGASADNGKRIECEVWPMTDWATKAVALGLHPAVAALIEGMDGPHKPHYPRLMKQ